MEYIGITDFWTKQQALDMLAVFDKFNKKENRKLMIGIMMSYKTLNDLPTKWKDIWISKDEIANVFPDHPSAFNTLHYADYDGIDLLRNLLDATSYCGSHLHAIQLDMIWPEPNDVLAYRLRYPDVKIVLQINSKAFEQIDNDPAKLVERLSFYEDSVDYVLLDKSGGKGIGMDADFLRPFIHELSKTKIKVAVAGGLGPNTLHRVEPLKKEYPFLSMDAQGQLKFNGDPLGMTDYSLAGEYVEKACQI